jgi:lipopolysaccharide biosynthesis glycosyltransferase
MITMEMGRKGVTNESKFILSPAVDINSGVLLMDLKGMREANVTADTFLETSRGMKTLFADQGILNAWMHLNQNRTGLLDCKLNKTKDSKCPMVLIQPMAITAMEFSMVRGL